MTSGYVSDAFFPDGTRRPGGTVPFRFARDAARPIIAPDTASMTQTAPDPEETNPPAPTMDDDMADRVSEFLKDKLSPEDHAIATEMLRQAMAQDMPPPFPGMPKPGGGMVPLNRKDQAMDIKTRLAIATDSAERNAVARFNKIREAERLVRPYTGEPSMACDSAEAIYREGLERLGHDTKSLHPSALRCAFDILKTTNREARARTFSTEGFFSRFPEAKRIG